MCLKFTLFFALLFNLAVSKAQQPSAIKNIVLVHGAFVDGYSSKEGILCEHRATTNDHVKRVLAMQDGSCILVGHSYGGAIITEAGSEVHVACLVYIAAHAPDKGENEAANGKLYPLTYKSLQKTEDGYDYIDLSRFFADFAADLPAGTARFTAHAWRLKPSWYMVVKSDRIINPELERMYAKRANSHTVEVDGASHSVYESHPNEVAQLIIDAAKSAHSKT